MRAVQVLRPCELTDDHWIAWAHLSSMNSHFDSAFYAPDLAWLVSTVREDVEVGVMTDGGEPVGFLPFLRSTNGMARTLEQYSPGLILLVHLAERAAADGIRRIDFGTTRILVPRR